MIAEPMDTVEVSGCQSTPGIILPDEICLQVFSYLDLIELATSELTCRQWKRLVEDSSLWKAHYLKLSDNWRPKEEPNSWKILIKRSFFLERCMRTIGMDGNSFLKAAESALYVFFNLCAGPQFFYRLPVNDGVFDPSIFRKSGACFFITRAKDNKTIHFSASCSEGKHKYWGSCKVCYSEEQGGMMLTFCPYIKLNRNYSLALTRDGKVNDWSLYYYIKQIVQIKMAKQLGATFSNPALSDPAESTLGRSHAWSLGE